MCQFIQFWVNISSNDFMLDIHVIFCHVWLFLFFFCKEMEKIWMMKEFFWSQTILFCSSSNLSYHSQMIFVFQFLCMVPGQKLWKERKRLCKSEFYLMEWKFVNFKEWRRIYCILKNFFLIWDSNLIEKYINRISLVQVQFLASKLISFIWNLFAD